MSKSYGCNGSGIGGSLLFIAVGAISGWIALHSVEGLLLGAVLGIFIELVCVVGLIPIAGPFVYIWASDSMFAFVGVSLPLLGLLGLVVAIFLTMVSTALLIAALT